MKEKHWFALDKQKRKFSIKLKSVLYKKVHLGKQYLSKSQSRSQFQVMLKNNNSLYIYIYLESRILLSWSVKIAIFLSYFTP